MDCGGEEEPWVSSTGRSLGDRVLGLVRAWWPVAAFLALVLVAQTIWSAQYSVAGHAVGHAADHLRSATPVFPVAFMSTVLLWALPRRGRGDLLLWLLLAATIASCLMVMAGNVRVINAIDGEIWNDAQASQLGPARPGFESGHDLAELGGWGAVVATMLIAGLLWLRGLVPAKIAAIAAAVSLLAPHFIAPGAGLVVLAVWAILARSRDLRVARSRPLHRC
jgi:hypothetical protein